MFASMVRHLLRVTTSLLTPADFSEGAFLPYVSPPYVIQNPTIIIGGADNDDQLLKIMKTLV